MKNENQQKFSVSEAGDCVRLAERKELENMKNTKPDNSGKEAIVYPTNMESPTVTMLCDECGAIIKEGQQKCWYCGQEMIWMPKTKKKRGKK